MCAGAKHRHGGRRGPSNQSPTCPPAQLPPQVPVVSSHTSEKAPPTAHMPLLSPPRPPSLSCRGHSVAEQGPWFEAVGRLGLLMVPELYACGGLGGSCQSRPDPAAPRQGQNSHLPLIQGWGGGLVAKSCPILVTPWTIACQAPLSMGFPRQEYWSGLPSPHISLVSLYFTLSRKAPVSFFLLSSPADQTHVLQTQLLGIEIPFPSCFSTLQAETRYPSVA